MGNPGRLAASVLMSVQGPFQQHIFNRLTAFLAPGLEILVFNIKSHFSWK